jgi:hypothetical protein
VPDRPAQDAACVCGEINTRHCPVHGQGEPSAASLYDFSEEDLARLLRWYEESDSPDALAEELADEELSERLKTVLRG